MFEIFITTVTTRLLIVYWTDDVMYCTYIMYYIVCYVAMIPSDGGVGREGRLNG
jgi:hypothetical protein